MTSLYAHSRNISSIAFVTLTIALAGCATESQRVREQRAAGVWQVRLPASQSPIGAYAAGGASGVSAGDTDRPADIDAYLKSDNAKAAAAESPRVRKDAPDAIAKAPTGVPTPRATPTPAAPDPIMTAASPPKDHASLAETSRDDLERYAQRDARADHAKNFRGGDVVVISVTTLLVVLLLVLVILLVVR